jgi:MYXO-CTERM domain-containing protein
MAVGSNTGGSQAARPINNRVGALLGMMAGLVGLRRRRRGDLGHAAGGNGQGIISADVRAEVVK